MSLTSEERKALAIECGAIAFPSPRVEADTLEDVFSDCYRLWPNELDNYTTAVEARGDERVAQLEEALRGALDGKMESHDRWVDPANKALSTSSDTWLADKIKEAEVRVLEEAADMLRAYSQDAAATQIENMAEARRAK